MDAFSGFPAQAKRAAMFVRLVAASGLVIALLASCSESSKTLVASAKDYAAKGDYSAAVIQLRNALQKAPDDAEARYLLGIALIERRDPAGAVKELRKALELGYPSDQVLPRLAKALFSEGDASELVKEFGDTSLSNPDAQAALKTMVGNAQLTLGKKKEAEAAFGAALAAKADFPDALIGIAAIRAADGDIDAARKIVDGVLARGNVPPEAWMLDAQLLLVKGDGEGGRRALEKALETKTDFLPARYHLTSLLIATGDLDKASAQIAEIRKISKQDARAYYFEALIAWRKGDFPAARAAIQQMLRAAPEHVPSLVLAGEIEYRSQQFNAAQDYLRRALKAAPGLLYAQRLLAATYLRLGSPAHALEVLQQPLNRGYRDPALTAVAAEAYLASGDLPKAAQYFAQTSTLDPKNASARARLGQVRFAEGDTEGALRDLEAASALDANVGAADLALITNLLQQKKFDQALAAVGRLEKKQPKNPLVYNLKGIVYLSKRDSANARSAFEQALQLQPNYVPAINNLAQLDRLENKPEAARKRYEAIIQKEPNNEQALLGFASLVQSLGGDASEVESLIKKAVAANPQSVPARAALVAFYARRGDNKQALVAAQEANAAMPNDPRTLELLGQVQQASGETAQAIETFTKLVAAQPGTVDPLRRLAGALVAAKEYDKAIEKLREASTINPGLLELRREIASVYVIAGHSELALKEIKAIQRQAPDDKAGYLLEGELWATKQQWPEAQAAFLAAQKRAPADGVIATKLYVSTVSAGKRSEADATAEKWLKEHPKDVVLQSYLGDRSVQDKDYKAASRHYQAVLVQQPDNPIALNNLAWVSGELGDPKAVGYAEKAAALAPNSAAILDTLGTLQVKKGDLTPGLERLRKAVQLAPYQADFRLHLAKGLIKAGDKEGAKKELDALAEASKQPPAQAGADRKGAEAQKSGSAPAAARAQLVCNPDCAAETAALLKTL